MLDVSFVRNHPDRVIERTAQRGIALSLEEFSTVDKRRRELLTQGEQLKATRNKASEEIAVLKKNKQDASSKIAEMKAVSDQITDFDLKVRELDLKLRDWLLVVPNIPHETVPVGKTAEENREERRWGTPPSFNFQAKDHTDLGETLGILDFERASKISGARFALYKGVGARMERALINFMLDVQTKENSYTEVLPPFIVNSASLLGTGNLPKFAEDLFRLKVGEETRDLWMIPTAEVPVTNIYRDEILDEAQLPISLCAYTPCFRSEAGSYGKDTRGLIRQHQFNKVELVKFSRPDTSYQEHEKLTRDAETILQKLNLHYRVVTLCTGDMGFSSAKTYDIEVWLPSQNGFREISSCSNFEAFQARRANIRYRPREKGKVDFVHTLNGSGLAVGRTWLAIVENYQQKNGSVVIPEALRPYMEGMEVIEPAQ
ncbi:MAG: serine--tRNA ligase [Acidobacteriia bacterium]|nr:serine--tRNA ligase [Terriglobia bacterium]